MRLLNSVCKRLAQKYNGIPVYIEDLPEGFSRPSFFVTLATEGTNLKNKNVYEDTPIYQIVFHGRKNAGLNRNILECKAGIKGENRMNTGV